MGFMDWLKDRFTRPDSGNNTGPFAQTPGQISNPFNYDPVVNLPGGLRPKSGAGFWDPEIHNSYTPKLDFPNAGRGVADNVLRGDGNFQPFYDALPPTQNEAASPVPQSDPQQALLDNIMKMILGAGSGSSSTLTAKQASGAYRPLLNALDAEKAAARERNKSNKWESAKDYKGIENQYRLERRNAVKNNVLAKEKLNKEIAKNKVATRQEYTKQAAENKAEMQGAGIGTSAQVMARQALEQRATEEANMQEAIATENANNRREMQRSQEAYLGEQIPVMRQAREEADLGYDQKLEDVLLALTKERAGVMGQALSAANSVRMSQQDNSLKKAGSMMDLLRLTKELAPEAPSTETPFFAKGAAGANDFARSFAAQNNIPQQAADDVIGVIAGDQEIQNGGFGNPENRIPLNPANVQARVNEYAKKYNWSPAQKGLALIYAERISGLYGDPKNPLKEG